MCSLFLCYTEQGDSMVKVDLITGFLGSGKTTFIRKYVNYLVNQGEKICILENDLGAINVDMMLLSDLQSDRVGIEMVAGGCDYDCHKRRFKTKLITMAMLGYNRVIIEPSGIFDVDEFFDLLHEDPLYDRYTIDNVLAIVDANLEDELSLDAQYMLASQVSQAGRIILSRSQLSNASKMKDTIARINTYLKDISCIRQFTNEITTKDWNLFTEEDFKEIVSSGYRETGFVKRYSMDDNKFQSIFFMNVQAPKDTILENIKDIWKDSKVGNILRIKGFLQDENGWYEINATKEGFNIQPISIGQSTIIVIGENLNAKEMDTYIPAEYSTEHVS